MSESEYEMSYGGPGPEDRANGAAALAAALVREAQVLAATAASLRTALAAPPGDPSGGPLSDVRRLRAAQMTGAEAALRATLLLEASVLVTEGDAAATAEKLVAAARRSGLAPAALAAPVRAAMLTIATDDGGARIAATLLATDIAMALATAS